MPQDGEATSEKRPEPSRSNKQTGGTTTSSSSSSSTWPTTPQPIKRLFDKFPVRTYPVNELPERSPPHRDRHALWIFTTKQGAQLGAPSFNPGCLKWQAYLKFQGVDFVTVASNNHASPTGALPFLLPASDSSNLMEAVFPIPSNRIERWVRETKTRSTGEKKEEKKRHSNTQLKEVDPHAENIASADQKPADIRYEAYLSLINYRIRNAYLYSLYLCPPNFAAIVLPLYIEPNTSNSLARFALSSQLRAAAETELRRQSPVIDVEALVRDCDGAFGALSELLGADEFFFGEDAPGLFDASVFAYTNVFLDEGLEWKQRRVREGLDRYGNLVAHRERIMEGWFGDNA